MNLALRIDNNIIAAIISIIFLKNILGRLDKSERKNRIFVSIFILNTIELIVETLTCIINKQPYAWLIPITTFLHVTLFALAPLVTYRWYTFAKLWITKTADYKAKDNILILLPIIINTFLVLLTPFFKFDFYINKYNVYQRESLFFTPFVISYFYLLCGFISIYKNKKYLNRIEFWPLILFGVFPTLASLIQFLIYGPLLMWSSISFSLIILYLYLQQQMMHIDYLTGAWTREKFYSYLSNRINQKKSKSFSIVLIDIDDFKIINDTFGHNEGDKALISLVTTINSIIGNENSITRYGGDEFILLLNVCSKQEVETIIKKISDALAEHIKHSNRPYKLNFSYGYELYDFDKHSDISEYINHVDKLMYKHKNSKKKKCL
ncbi:GGDEF domain-containing protein [Clostridium neuense]|uniref:GGDEF domain-containing protein n=1 Tax=Clostridium neuense TaxID=1728934 RepID=A0ABW8TA84_9CLOT